MGAKFFAVTATIQNTEEITYHMKNVFAYVEFAPITGIERNSPSLGTGTDRDGRQGNNLTFGNVEVVRLT